MCDMDLRRINQEDYPELSRLVHDTYHTFLDSYITLEKQSELDTALGDQNCLDSMDHFGMFENDKLVGEISLANEGSYIVWLFIDGKYHGKGIGRRLIQLAINRCKSDVLAVHAAQPSVGFYEKLGFKKCSNMESDNGIKHYPMYLYTNYFK